MPFKPNPQNQHSVTIGSVKGKIYKDKIINTDADSNGATTTVTDKKNNAKTETWFNPFSNVAVGVFNNEGKKFNFNQSQNSDSKYNCMGEGSTSYEHE